MTLEEFRERLKNEEDWAQGWDAVESVFAGLYPGQEPAHFGTNMLKRAMFGGDMWAIDMLSNLARYTYTQKSFFEPFQYISGDGNSICRDRESKITALLIVSDTEAQAVDTIYGKTEFIQLVGITENELSKVKEDRENAKRLYELMKQENPNLVTDLNREKDYI